MKIAVLSGKGGAGKTFTAVNLAAVSGEATYIDCDVEEPNGRLFFRPKNVETKPVYKLLPEFDEAKCTGCRKCVEFCRFNALIFIKNKPLLFDEVCHSCGGCLLVCQENAISEKKHQVGRVEVGQYRNIKVVTGELNTGEASGVPIISEALKEGEGDVIIDCPPGSACSVMESMADASLCVLVAEPTAFGFDNFKMVYELASLLGKPCAVVINKQDEVYEPLESFCRQNNLPVVGRIPFNRRIAELAGKGLIVSEADEQAAQIFEEIYSRIKEEVMK